MNEPLPGMSYGDLPATAIEDAARRQLERLTELGVLTADHDILREAILALAHSMGISARKGQSVGLAQASKELRDWYLLIPALPTDDDDPFTQLMRRMTAQDSPKTDPAVT